MRRLRQIELYERPYRPINFHNGKYFRVTDSYIDTEVSDRKGNVFARRLSGCSFNENVPFLIITYHRNGKRTLWDYKGRIMPGARNVESIILFEDGYYRAGKEGSEKLYRYGVDDSIKSLCCSLGIAFVGIWALSQWYANEYSKQQEDSRRRWKSNLTYAQKEGERWQTLREELIQSGVLYGSLTGSNINTASTSKPLEGVRSQALWTNLIRSGMVYRGLIDSNIISASTSKPLEGQNITPPSTIKEQPQTSTSVLENTPVSGSVLPLAQKELPPLFKMQPENEQKINQWRVQGFKILSLFLENQK